MGYNKSYSSNIRMSSLTSSHLNEDDADQLRCRGSHVGKAYTAMGAEYAVRSSEEVEESDSVSESLNCLAGVIVGGMKRSERSFTG